MNLPIQPLGHSGNVNNVNADPVRFSPTLNTSSDIKEIQSSKNSSPSFCAPVGKFFCTIFSYIRSGWNWLVDTVSYYLFGYGPGATKPSGKYYQRGDLKGILTQTLEAVKKKAYSYNDKKVSLPAIGKTISQAFSRVGYAARAVTSRLPEALQIFQVYKSKGHETSFSVVNQDAVYAGIDLKKQYKKVAILNPANAYNPGGGARGGCAAMEEDLCRRSSLLPELEAVRNNGYYPLVGSNLLFSHDVPFFRYGRDRHYAYMEKPETLSVITSAAVDLSPEHAKRSKGAARSESERFIPTDRDTHEQKEAKLKAFIEETKERIYAQLYRAANEGMEAVVLTAFGCGAFQNDPEVVARIYQDVLNEYFKGVFKNITFAVIDDHNAKKAHNPKGNHLPFAEVFAEN